ncbi:MAG: TRAP transporter small permease subunit [Lachnospiraceae bacterium]|nr:TRAP transporter small permease subunit [Lachnospiraceae bacterium]
METMKKINHILDKICTWLAYLSCLVVFIMMCHIVIDVLLRTVFKIVVLGTYETTQYVYMPTIILAAFAFTYRCGVLPKFDTFTTKGSDAWKKGVQVWIMIIEVIVFFLLAFYSYQAAGLALADKRAVMGGGRLIPTWWVFFISPVSFTIMLIDCVVEKICMFMDWKHNKPVEGASEAAATQAFSAEITEHDEEGGDK